MRFKVHRRLAAIAARDPAFGPLQKKPLTETNSECLLKVTQKGTVSTNVYLRRIHNYALDMDWLLKSIIPKRQWPKIVHGKRRSITFDEHQRIIARELNEERKAFYQLCWHLGGSQSAELSELGNGSAVASTQALRDALLHPAG